MRNLILSGAIVFFLSLFAFGDKPYREPNYDESKIPPYTLEDPLAFADGTKLKSPAEWPKRREEILGIFAREMYGQPPPKPEAVVTEVWDVKNSTAAGFAVRKQVRMWFKKDKTGPCVNWIVFAPRHAKKPSPVILFLNYRGNHELVPDKDVYVQKAWTQFVEKSDNYRASARTRGAMTDPDKDTIFPLGMLIARGYAVMSACYCEVSPDPDWTEKNPAYRQDPFAYTGVFELWGKRDESRTDNPTAIGAWAWALSRGLDYAETDPLLDAKRSVVTGCSRLGKAALLAAARDERFAVCVPNQTGGGGAPLAKRDYGENTSTENVMFTHWYCKAYRKYSEKPWETLTFDQHMLLAAVAPRALLVQGFDTSRWMHTKGEYLACRAAAPVWKFLGRGTMPDVPYPDNYCTSGIGESFGYVRRSEGHGISAHDWMWLLDFADREFARKELVDKK